MSKGRVVLSLTIASQGRMDRMIIITNYTNTKLLLITKSVGQSFTISTTLLSNFISGELFKEDIYHNCS